MIKFGTSGFRGIISDTFTKENVMRVAYAIAMYIKQKRLAKHPVVVGYDNRFMGKEFAQWFIEVLVAYKIKVKFYDYSTPSPLISHDTKNKHLGVHITASHNPYFYNGIKIFQTGGRETTEAQNLIIENLANSVDFKTIQSISYAEVLSRGAVRLTRDIKPYCKSVMSQVEVKNFGNRKIKVLFNAMKGSGRYCGEYVLKKLRVNFTTMNSEVNPNFDFSLPAPYKQNLTDQAKRVVEEKFSLGFALDGDGDRVSFIDENGEFYDCNYISALIYDYLVCDKQLKCDFVKNCALTELIDKIANTKNYRTPIAKVGFKNIAEKMIEDPSALIGAESNGVAFKGHTLHKDGLLTAVILIEIMSIKNKPLSQLIKDLKKKYSFPCKVVEYAYPTTAEQKAEITKKIYGGVLLPDFPQKITLTSYVDGVKYLFDKHYWCVIRFSGNENVLRLFAEQPTQKQSEEYIKIMEDFVGLKIRQ